MRNQDGDDWEQHIWDPDREDDRERKDQDQDDREQKDGMEAHMY